MSPQTSSDSWLKSSGPGCRPYIWNAASMTAVVPEPGTPSASSGTRLPPALALLAASGPATPSMAPSPNSSGVFDTRRSTSYERKLATVAPAPGSTPVKKPMSVPRPQAGIDRRHSDGVSRAGPSRRVTPVGASSRVAACQNTSPTAKRPTVTSTTFRPPSRPGIPMEKRACPVCTSMPTVPRARPTKMASSPRAGVAPDRPATLVRASTISAA